MYLTARIIRLKNIIKIEINKTIDMQMQILIVETNCFIKNW